MKTLESKVLLKM